MSVRDALADQNLLRPLDCLDEDENTVQREGHLLILSFDIQRRTRGVSVNRRSNVERHSTSSAPEILSERIRTE